MYAGLIIFLFWGLYHTERQIKAIWNQRTIITLLLPQKKNINEIVTTTKIINGNNNEKVAVLMVSDQDLPLDELRKSIIELMNKHHRNPSSPSWDELLILLPNDISHTLVAVLSNFVWAQRHGYHFRYVKYPSTVVWNAADALRSIEEENHRSIHFWKSYETVEVMYDLHVDWVMYLDTDSIISNHSMTFLDLIKMQGDDDKAMAASFPNEFIGRDEWLSANFSRQASIETQMVFGKDVQKWPGVCSGTWAARNTWQVREHLCEWWWHPRLYRKKQTKTKTGEIVEINMTHPRDQLQLNTILLEALNSTETNFWKEYTSILPAQFFFYGKSVFHGTAGNSACKGCGKRDKFNKLNRLLFHLKKNSVVLPSLVNGEDDNANLIDTLKASVITRRTQQEGESHVCTVRRTEWDYPQLIWPEDVCSTAYDQPKKITNAIAFMVADPILDSTPESFSQDLIRTLESIAQAHEHNLEVDIILMHTDLDHWTSTSSKKIFQNLILSQTTSTFSYLRVIPMNESVRQQIESIFSAEFKQTIMASPKLNRWKEFEKLALWTLDQEYDSILFVDGGVTIRSPVQELFDCANSASINRYDFLSTADALGALSGDLFWLRPNGKVFESMIAYLNVGNYSNEAGWFNTGPVLSRYLNKHEIELVFHPNGTLKSHYGLEAFQSFLFWFFHILHSENTNGGPLAAQLDPCVYNTIDANPVRCLIACQRASKMDSPLTSRALNKGLSFNSASKAHCPLLIPSNAE